MYSDNPLNYDELGGSSNFSMQNDDKENEHWTPPMFLIQGQKVHVQVDSIWDEEKKSFFYSIIKADLIGRKCEEVQRKQR